MRYQQSPPSSILASKRSLWTDPAQIAANRQGIVTQEQRTLLDKGPGRLHGFVALLFSFSILSTCLLIAVVIQQLFAGEFRTATAVGLITSFMLTIVLGKLSSVLRRTHKARFQRAADAFIIERVQGEIVWEREQYIVRTPGFQLTISPKSPPLPPPGPYHFYYVAGQKNLLSMQAIHTFTQAFAQPGTLSATGLPGDEQARQALQLALCSTLGFSLADLDANRRGMLSNAQRRRLFSQLFVSIVLSLIGLVISGGLIVLVIVGIWNGSIPLSVRTDLPLSTAIVNLLMGGFIVLIILSLFGICLRYLTVSVGRRSNEIWRAPVQDIVDHLRRREESDDGSTSYYFDIGQISFSVSEDAYKAVVNRVLYRVYYLASSKTLVSVEPLEAPMR